MEDGEDCCRTPVGRDSRQDRPAHAGLSRASPAVSDLALQYLVSWLLVFAPTVRMSSYTSHLLHNLSSFVYTNAYVYRGGGCRVRALAMLVRTLIPRTAGSARSNPLP